MPTTPKQPSILDTCRAFADGNLDAPLAQNYQQQTLLVDDAGRMWSRLHSGTNPISPTNPLPVDIIGDISNPVWVDPEALKETAVAVAVPTKLLGLFVTNTVATPYFVHIFDSITPLVGAEVPDVIGHLPASGSYSLAFPRVMAVGITWGISTTPATYTAVGSDDFWTNVVHQLTP